MNFIQETIKICKNEMSITNNEEFLRNLFQLKQEIDFLYHHLLFSMNSNNTINEEEDEYPNTAYSDYFAKDESNFKLRVVNQGFQTLSETSSNINAEILYQSRQCRENSINCELISKDLRTKSKNIALDDKGKLLCLRKNKKP